MPGVDDGFRRLGADPFAAPPELRDPTRRLRGQLVEPVTVWTAYGPDERPAGVTVSSVLVAEGEPSGIIGLIGPVSDFWDAVVHSQRFVVHVLDADQARISDQLASRYPGDPFEGIVVSHSAHGPVLEEVGVRAACGLSGYTEAGYYHLVQGVIEDIAIGPDDAAPLVHYRGRYVTTALRSRRNPKDVRPGP
jgi:3-hydroxy-9,10-secoandrosta-1,3,5(10)-triene-9,17-dione monooxygenase reductase component